jgi:hypothetical protein
MHHVEVLDKQQLQAAMDLSASGKPPDAEWLFLRDARSLLNAGEFRRAVIDACTAAELAVTALIDRKFSAEGTSKAERMKQFDAHHGLSKLKSLHKKRHAAGKLPKRLVEDVGAPRNKAAHRGATLSDAEAHTAIATAAEVVEMAYPLSSVAPRNRDRGRAHDTTVRDSAATAQPVPDYREWDVVENSVAMMRLSRCIGLRWSALNRLPPKWFHNVCPVARHTSPMRGVSNRFSGRTLDTSVETA